MASDPLVKALNAAANEIAGWGASNEAGIVREAAKRITTLRAQLAACEAERLKLMADVEELKRQVAKMRSMLDEETLGLTTAKTYVARKAMEGGR